METIVNKILLVLLVIVLGGVGLYYYRSMQKSPGENSFDPQVVGEAVEGGSALLLDVRTEKERAESGYAAGSTHFDIARLEAGELPDSAHDIPVYTYCAAGGRAERAKSILQEAGFTNVTNIGGLSDWEAAGGEVVR